MTQNSSYTVDVTSDIVDKLDSALKQAGKTIDGSRAKKLKSIQKKVNDLRERGLLNKQKFVSVSTSDFERRYYCER